MEPNLLPSTAPDPELRACKIGVILLEKKCYSESPWESLKIWSSFLFCTVKNNGLLYLPGFSWLKVLVGSITQGEKTPPDL